MSEKKLCYALVYTGNNKKILARTILTYEKLKTVTRKNIFIITDDAKNLSYFEKFISKDKLYVPSSLERFYFPDNNFDGHRYPNIFMKFAVYELAKFGYTHVLFIDSDIVINKNGLSEHLSVLEREITELKEGYISAHKYYPHWPESLERKFIASCMGFNIKENIIQKLLDCNVPGKTEEWTLKVYEEKYGLVFELPEGLITNESALKKFTVFYHTCGKLYYSVLKVTDPEGYERFKEIFENIEEEKLEDDCSLI